MISVIIPCYNYGHLIGDTIASVLQQSYSDIEIVIIDDGSSDDTEKVVRSYCSRDSRVFYYKYPNAGLGTSRNRGLEKASGQFIQFLDADDLIESKKFEVQLDFFRQHPEADIVYGSVRYFSKNPYDPADRLLTYWGPNKEWMPKHTGSGKNILPMALKVNFSHLSSPLFKTEIIKKVGTFDNEISAVADYHFLLRCAAVDAYFYYHDTPDTYSLVRWHPDNMSKNLNLMWSQEIIMRQKLAPILTDNTQSKINNTNAIRSIQYKLNKSWKRHLLSGGPFDFLKKVLQVLGIEKLVRKIFYKR